MKSPVAVLGFRPHTYWTAAVALSGSPRAPSVIERRRMVFAVDDERSVYHQAAEAPDGEAPALIARVRAIVEANAVREIAALLADLQGAGLAVETAVVPTGRPRAAQPLEKVLQSHSAIHAAEGDFYRDVVAHACAAVGLEVRRLPERDLSQAVRDLLGLDAAALDERLKEIGAALGPPWSEDYRLATQAAWGALMTGSPSSG